MRVSAFGTEGKMQRKHARVVSAARIIECGMIVMMMDHNMRVMKMMVTGDC